MLVLLHATWKNDFGIDLGVLQVRTMCSTYYTIVIKCLTCMAGRGHYPSIVNQYAIFLTETFEVSGLSGGQNSVARLHFDFCMINSPELQFSCRNKGVGRIKICIKKWWIKMRNISPKPLNLYIYILTYFCVSSTKAF